MNATDLLTSLRFRLDEPSESVWSDRELLTYLDGAVKHCVRKQSDVDESYHNHELQFPISAWRGIAGGAFVYDLPYWAYRVTSLRESETSGQGRNPNIPFRTLVNRSYRFWAFDRTNRIRLVNSAAIATTIELTKDPARLLKGTIDTDQFAQSSATVFFIRHSTVTPTGVVVEKEKNAYANAMFEFTGVDRQGHSVSGQRVRASASETVFSNDQVAYTKVTIDGTFTVVPNAGDTFEMLPEVQPVHHEYVVLLAARKALLKKANLQQLQAIKDEFKAEEENFLNGITPRQTQEIPHIGMDRNDPRYYDQDVDTSRTI